MTDRRLAALLAAWSFFTLMHPISAAQPDATGAAPSSVGADSADESDVWISTLAARDSQLAKLYLVYDKTVTTIEDPKADAIDSLSRLHNADVRDRGRSLDPQTQNRIPSEPYVLESTFRERLWIEDRVTTFEHRLIALSPTRNGVSLDLNVVLPNANRRLEIVQRRTNADDRQRSRIVGGASDLLHVDPRKQPVSPLDHERMSVEFSLGFGFGSRLVSVDSVFRTPEGVVLRGEIRIWWKDHSTCDLLVDEDLIVRHAVINQDVDGNRHQYIVSNTGRFAGTQTLALPERGEFRKSWTGRMVDGELLGDSRTVRDISLTLREASIAPPADIQSRLSDFAPGESTLIVDRSTGRTTMAQPKLDKLPQQRRWYVWWVVFHASAIPVIILWWRHRSRVVSSDLSLKPCDETHAPSGR